MPLRTFKDLVVWQKAMDLVVEVYFAQHAEVERMLAALRTKLDTRAARLEPLNPRTPEP